MLLQRPVYARTRGTIGWGGGHRFQDDGKGFLADAGDSGGDIGEDGAVALRGRGRNHAPERRQADTRSGGVVAGAAVRDMRVTNGP